MPTDPNLNGNRHNLTFERRLGDLEESFEDVKIIAAQCTTAVQRAHDVADNGRELALELRESISNHSHRMKELDRSIRENSIATGDAASAVILLQRDMGIVLKTLGRWPSDPDDLGSGLSGRIATIGRHMGLDERFSRASSVNWEAEAEEAKRITALVEARVSSELQRREQEKLQSDFTKTTQSGYTLTLSDREALKEVKQKDKEKKGTIPPALKAAWKLLPSGVQSGVVVIAAIASFLWAVWQGYLASKGQSP